jgi:hypothetical protein
MKITKHLAQFLAEEGVLTEFVVNHINQCGEYHDRIISGVGYGFIWRNTPEEHHYWHKLSVKYNKYYNEDN